MLRDTFGPTIEANFKANKKKLKEEIMRYIDRNSNILYSVDLTERLFFSDDDRAIVYVSMGVREDQVEDAAAKSKDINTSFKVSSNPFYLTCTLMVREAILKNDSEMASMISVLMSCMMYSSMHSQFLKFDANKNIMTYTVNNLDNNFKFKKLGSLFALLEDNVQTWLNTYKSRFQKGTDNDLVYIINALQTRIKGKLRKIFNEFYKNWESGRYLNMDTSSYNEENYKLMDNNSYAVSRLSDKVYLNMIQKGINDTVVKYSITRSDTSYEKLRVILSDIIKNDGGEVVKVINALIEHYVHTSGNAIDTIYKGEFVSYMIKAYASNTEASSIKYVKATLDTWMTENSSRYGNQRYGKTAMVAYKKSIYMYFVYMINLNSKTG